MTVPEWLKAVGASALPHFGGIAGAFVASGQNKDVWYEVSDQDFRENRKWYCFISNYFHFVSFVSFHQQ